MCVSLEFFFLNSPFLGEDNRVSRSRKKLPDGGGVASNTLGTVVLCLWQGWGQGAAKGLGWEPRQAGPH